MIRPHTDPSLGHCSYLNTCYSEPTYASSPSVLPFHKAAGGRQGGGNLPNGLGAGGAGKSKAPCRYLHFEVDWDERDAQVSGETRPQKTVESYKLRIGLGPDPESTKLVITSQLTVYYSKS